MKDIQGNIKGIVVDNDLLTIKGVDYSVDVVVQPNTLILPQNIVKDENINSVIYEGKVRQAINYTLGVIKTTQ